MSSFWGVLIFCWLINSILQQKILWKMLLLSNNCHHIEDIKCLIVWFCTCLACIYIRAGIRIRHGIFVDLYSARHSGWTPAGRLTLYINILKIPCRTRSSPNVAPHLDFTLHRLLNTHTHIHTHTHARTHARIHTHTRT